MSVNAIIETIMMVALMIQNIFAVFLYFNI